MKLQTFAVFTLAFFTITCSQSPIFHIISTETKPTKPRIEGAPTNMVVFNWEDPDTLSEKPIMFVASGRLHWYAQEEVEREDPDDPGNTITRNVSRWDARKYGIPQPSGKITSLAVTKDPDRLYALCLVNQSTNGTLRYIESGDEKWTTIPNSSKYLLQSIYADHDKLFAGGRKGNSFGILYLKNDSLEILENETEMLSGAVYKGGFFYLSTRTNMIFQVDEDINIINRLQDKNDDDTARKKVSFRSMIKLEDDTIIAVTRDGGFLYKVENGSLSRILSDPDNKESGMRTGRWATGALCLWQDEDRGLKKLIAGIQGGLNAPYTSSSTSYTHGYVEFDLNPNGSFNENFPRRDAGRLETVENADRYTTSLGKQPINHLFQAPPEIDESNTTFFASTQTAGLWSYRDRPSNGGWQWNAEE
jgi:hypothetical protein